MTDSHSTLTMGRIRDVAENIADYAVGERHNKAMFEQITLHAVEQITSLVVNRASPLPSEEQIARAICCQDGCKSRGPAGICIADAGHYQDEVWSVMGLLTSGEGCGEGR